MPLLEESARRAAHLSFVAHESAVFPMIWLCFRAWSTPTPKPHQRGVPLDPSQGSPVADLYVCEIRESSEDPRTKVQWPVRRKQKGFHGASILRRRAPMNLIDILTRTAFGFSLLILLTAFIVIAGAVAWKLFRYFRPGQQPADTLPPETDFWYYRQRHRRCIQLLLDRVMQLKRDLNAAQHEIARLKGFPAGPIAK